MNDRLLLVAMAGSVRLMKEESNGVTMIITRELQNRAPWCMYFFSQNTRIRQTEYVTKTRHHQSISIQSSTPRKQDTAQLVSRRLTGRDSEFPLPSSRPSHRGFSVA